jgi:nitric-oxide synthase
VTPLSLTSLQEKLLSRALDLKEDTLSEQFFEVRNYLENETVVLEGTSNDEAYVVVEGSVRVSTFDQNKNPIVLELKGIPSLVGEEACYSFNSAHRNTIKAAEKLKVIVIPGALIRKLFRQRSNSSSFMSQDDRLEALRKLSNQSSIGKDVAELLQNESEIETKSLKPGEILFSEGDRADFSCLVLAGKIEALKWDNNSQKIVGSSGIGTFVGEVGVLENAPRAATVRAIENTDLLIIPAEVVRKICSKSQVQALTSALKAGYNFSGRGAAFSVVIPGETEDRVSTIIKLAKNRQISISRTLISEMVVAHEEKVSDKKLISQDGRYSIEVCGGLPVRIEGPQDWPDLPNLMDRMLSGEALEPWRLVAFEAHGTLMFSEEDETSTDAVVCACTGVTKSGIRNQSLSGITTLDEIGKACGAGGVCGGCRNRLSNLLGRENFNLCQAEVEPLCEGSIKVTLRPINEKIQKPSAGQYVSIDGLIKGNWVSRSYTVVHGDENHIELGVKIEEQGTFSRWLSKTGNGSLVRVSNPQGEEIPKSGGGLLFVVAGIGVTPAIAALRNIKNQRKLHICYIFRGEKSAAFLSELKSAEKEGIISLSLWDSSTQGRPDLSAFVNSGVSDSEVKEAIVCGPVSFADVAAQILRSKNLHVRTETFTHSGIADGPPLVCPGSWRKETASITSKPWNEYSITRPGTKEDEARAFLKQFFYENGVPAAFESRWDEVKAEFKETGTYWQSIEELTFGAKLSWRNASRCIGRLYWSGLRVRDFRHLTHPDDMAHELVRHLEIAYNDGDLTPTMTVFNPGTPGTPAVRIWNPQLMRYAGYRGENNEVIGDPAQLDLTKEIESLGWNGPKTNFDMLPIVIHVNGQKPRYYEIPNYERYEIEIRHPEYSGINELALKWYSVPAVSDMALDCGGVLYQCAPFNGWYMGTEIGARNFTDVERYNLSLKIAEKMGLETKRENNLWRDKALTAMTEAVLDSFEKKGIKIIDHHSAALEFLQFCENEQDQSREVFGDWTWLVPPIGGSATPLFLDGWKHEELKPALRMQEPDYPLSNS